MLPIYGHTQKLSVFHTLFTLVQYQFFPFSDKSCIHNAAAGVKQTELSGAVLGNQSK